MQDVNFDNSYAALPERFFARQLPVPVSRPRAIRVNHDLARQLGFEPAFLESAEGAAILSGNRIPDGAAPIATAYAGHQFGGWNPQLGDGRAILLGEIIDASGRRYDLQLKGSGRTPYSRSGDGRAPLGPVLREYLVSEAMFALGIPTTRTLGAATTGDLVHRDRALPGGVLVRVASSHIRVGTFEYFSARGDHGAVHTLVDHVLARHYPDVERGPSPGMDLLRAVVFRQAELIAQWQLVGFIHGVMNTDNMLVSGETVDYGPCAFMDEYDPETVFSSIDRGGRYAFGNQPRIAQWNLACLAQALLGAEVAPDVALEAAQEAIDGFTDVFTQATRRGMARKLALGQWADGDDELVENLFQLMHREAADFTNTFRVLAAGGGEARTRLSPAFEPWLDRWETRLEREPTTAEQRRDSMLAASPAVIPRNHRVEAAIVAAVERDDFGPFHELMEVLRRPFEARPELDPYIQPPGTAERVCATFCGT